MYKPWPKCPICSHPMIFSGAVAMTDAGPRSEFECERCPPQKPKPSLPSAP